MAGEIRANINPEILVLAKLTSDYSKEEAPRKIGTSIATLQALEKANAEPVKKNWPCLYA